jgi:UDP-N-acetylglucosamine 2-epimerase (non-hydrolysing)
LRFLHCGGNLIRPKLGGRLRFADIRLVIGTRPEAIKLSPVARALAARGLAPTLIFTGQHRLAAREFGLEAFALETLDCPGDEDPHHHVRAVTAALLPRLKPAPDLLVVQGDTSSALGAALAAFTAGVTVAHVEAGLRTHDPQLPWPEEEYRTAIDAQADLLFAPTAGAAANLRAECVAGEIYVTGNTGIDALVEAEAALPPRVLRETGSPRILVTCHRRESWGEGLQEIASALRMLARSSSVTIDVILHPNEHVAAAMKASLESWPGVSLLAPCGHHELVRRMRDATLVLSDSGGIQEEAPALGVPLLVLREKTERPEGLQGGSTRLVGTSAERIVEEVERLLADPIALGAMSRQSFPYGDGRSATRIAAIIEDWLERCEPASSSVRSAG